ncbi:hypothetical protein F4677DRAFT_431483 [Hypoxylon crocopeplum]|nr:hypothetical protein F4677DRAFT_431483 [Hypoxylon crocopeplum]
MRTAAYLHLLAFLACSHFAIAVPTGRDYNLAQIYIQALGSNMVANDTETAPPPPATSTTDTDKVESECKPFEMPRVPAECVMKSGELVCIGYSLYCRFPTDFGVGYDPVGECWSCK